MSTPDNAVIRTVDLTKIYSGTVRAVDTLNLTVFQGEIFGLLGPNGAGKTTTASMLTTRTIPTHGQAFVGGVDVVAHPAIAKQLIGVVPQTNTLDRALTVWENLYFHGKFFGMGTRASREAADEMLVKFRLTERAKAPVMALSGGLAQRLMVARAILHNPAVLFLDEPTAGLDPQSRIALWEILGELHTGGQTVLLTTHNMEEADSLCDRIGIMDHGRILALDTPARLKETIGADTMVTVTADGDLDALALRLRQDVAGVEFGRDPQGNRPARRARWRPRAPASHRQRRPRRLRRARCAGRRAEPRDRVHQSHRQGASRMTAPSPPRRPSRPRRRPCRRCDRRSRRRGSRSARCCCATWWC